MPPWILWLFLAALLILPVCAAFIEDRPPDNQIVHESGGDREDDTGAAEMTAAA